ncbi:MAG: SUMF1/EgtB/PvdO family nonheme iron enzyme [Pirellulales bacterium]
MTDSKPTVRIIRVFVSSPGDVQNEREVLSSVVEGINTTDGQYRGFRLELFRWEKNTAPLVGPKPQPAVDAQTPPYDIYLGIMSVRFGTPTDTADSGTEEEFNAALDKWQALGEPWIMFYFNDAPNPKEVRRQLAQYTKVCEFRETLEKQGLVAGYEEVEGGDSAFRTKVDLHLRKVVHSIFPMRPAGPRDSSQPTRVDIPSQYLPWLQSECAGIDLLGMRLKEGQSLRLTQVYVPLITLRLGDESRNIESPHVRHQAEKPQLLLDLFDRQSLYVSGPPGSGKSTFARWVAWLCCSGSMPAGQQPGPEGYRESFPESLRGKLPVLIRLRDFYDSLPKIPGCDALTLAQFEQSLAQWLAARKPGGLTWDCLKHCLEEGRALVIFDGVDEVPLDEGGPDRPWYPRKMLLSGLTQASSTWTARGNRLLVTSRPYGLDDVDRQRLGLTHAPLSDLDDKLQQLLVQRWFGILADDPAKGGRFAAEFWADVQQRQDIRELLSNPMLLTAVCIIFNEGKRLPQDRHELYVRIIDNVLYARFRSPAQIDLHRNRLGVIAYAMHTGEGLGESRSTPRAEALVSEVDRALSSYQEKRRYTEEGFLGVTQTREKLLSDSGLFLPRDGNRAAFYHLSIQEHLAAQWLLDREEAELADLFVARSAVREWRHTLSFAFGALLARSAEPTKAVQLLETLLERMTRENVRLQVVIADCLQVLLGRDLRLREPSQQKFREACLAAIDREVELADRHVLGLALGRIGDPRIVVDLRSHDPRAFVRIEAGEYAYQEGRQTIEHPFLLSRFPVTNSQYYEFMKDEGYKVRRFWSDEGWAWKEQERITEPYYWRHPLWNVPNQSVVGVSWYEAEAFCRWAGGQLPSERHWEAAARGAQGREYPWGDTWTDGICNSRESMLRMTSAAGLFPQSRTPEGGLEDLAGNVWEWCEDVAPPSGHVIRGGCWSFSAGGCRSAFRFGDSPRDRNYFLGFRVSLSSSR